MQTLPAIQNTKRTLQNGMIPNTFQKNALSQGKCLHCLMQGDPEITFLHLLWGAATQQFVPSNFLLRNVGISFHYKKEFSKRPGNRTNLHSYLV